MMQTSEPEPRRAGVTSRGGLGTSNNNPLTSKTVLYLRLHMAAILGVCMSLGARGCPTTDDGSEETIQQPVPAFGAKNARTGRRRHVRPPLQIRAFVPLVEPLLQKGTRRSQHPHRTIGPVPGPLGRAEVNQPLHCRTYQPAAPRHPRTHQRTQRGRRGNPRHPRPVREDNQERQE